MKIVPSCIAFIILLFGLNKQIKAQDFPRDTSYTYFNAYQKYVKQYPDITYPSLTFPGEVKEQRDLVYKNTGNRNLHLDVYSPADIQSEPLPALFMIHGGGWISGDKSLLYNMATHLAKNQFVTVNIEYRLSPEAKYPAAVYDIKTAIKWMKDHALTFNIDTNRVGILGTSAGGQLAALVGVTADDPKFEDPADTLSPSTRVHAIIDIDGVLAFIHPDSEEGTVAGKWLGGDQTEAKEKWIEASALTHIDSSAPPTLFIGSSNPRFLAGNHEFSKVLRENGIYTETYVIEDSPHSFWLFNPWFKPTIKYTTNFLNTVFR